MTAHDLRCEDPWAPSHDMSGCACASRAETVRRSYDPTDTETGGLAASWAASRAAVLAHPDWKDTDS